MELRELKFATRKLIKDSNHTLINLIGLTISISFSFLIFLYVFEQSSYDKHIADAENIYRVSSDFHINGHQDIYSNSPRPMGKTLVEEFPSIIAATKIMGYNGLQIHSGFMWQNENHIKSDHLFVADSNFLKVFNLPLLQGDVRALHNPNSAIISKTTAKKLFGSEEPMGQTIKLEDQSTAQVTGVFEDLPNASYMKFEVIVSYTTFYPGTDSEIWWYGGHVYTYIKTTSSFEPKIVQERWDDFFNKYMKPTFDELNGTANIILQPLLDLYLSEEFIWEPYPHGSETNIQTFTLIGIFLLLVAAFNYTNLSLSYAFHRQEEMRTKRILGANKIQIVKQNLTEAALTSVLIALLSISLVGTLLPIFNQFTEQVAPINLITTPSHSLIILGMSLMVTLAASVFPSFKIASMASDEDNPNNLTVRKIFVSGQLSIAVALIACTIIVVDQLSYLRRIDVGFDKENLVVLHINDRNLRKDLDAFQNKVKTISGVVDVTRIDEPPVTGANEFTYQLQSKSGTFVSNPSQTFEVGHDFFKTMGIDLIAGRPFRTEDTEYKGVIINEFLSDKMGYSPEEAIGAKMIFGEDDPIDRKVIGVAKDFRLGSVHDPDQAMTISLNEPRGRYLIIRLDEKNQQKTINKIKSEWSNFGSNLPFQYTVMTDDFGQLLARENRLFELLVIGSILIILISCLGLIGLVAHIVTQRTKEIGIRKVMGASSTHLYALLQKDFLKTYLIALAIGSVVAWFIGNSWLENYSYRIEMSGFPFATTAVISLLIILFTLSYHTFHIIKSNPIDSLRDE